MHTIGGLKDSRSDMNGSYYKRSKKCASTKVKICCISELPHPLWYVFVLCIKYLFKINVHRQSKLYVSCWFKKKHQASWFLATITNTVGNLWLSKVPDITGFLFYMS